MARVQMRELFRFRSTVLTHPSPTASNSRRNLYSSSSSSPCPSSTSNSQYTNSGPGKYSIFLHNYVGMLLRSCQSKSQLFQIQAHMIASGIFYVPFLSRTFLRHASDLCDIPYTLLIFRYINSFDPFAVNTVIKAYCHSSAPYEGLVFYFQLVRNGFYPNSYTFVQLFGYCAKMGCFKSGLKYHGQVIKCGVEDVLPVQNSLIHMYGCCGYISLSRKVFEEMLVRDLVSWNSIVEAFVKFSDLGNAHFLFDRMPDRNVVSWNIMISGYLKDGNPGCGLKLFRKMMKAGVIGNDRTIVCVLTTCGRSARLREGRSVHGSIFRTFTSSNLIMDSALIEMYCKCQRVDVARKVFERMMDENLVCWNAMILGHCIHGNPEEGLDLFHEMVGTTKTRIEDIEFDRSIKTDKSQVRFLPDEITFVGVLCACARAELLEQGVNYFKQMTNTFCVRPNFAHIWCMTNLLAKLGLVQQAEEFIRNMAEFDEDISSDSLVLARLLGLSRLKGDVLFGEQLALSLIDIEPHNCSFYQFLLNVYAAAGRWEDVSRVKEMMKERMLRGKPGSGLVDLKEVVHEFKLTNNSFQENLVEIKGIMDKMANKLGLLGFASNQPPADRRQTRR